jgi:WD repeat-containing protein 7
VLSGYFELHPPADGRIRQSSLMEMCGTSQPSPRTKVSAQALQGYITGLHAIYHPLTREKLIIGGADDGSIAFWTVEWVFFTFFISLRINYCISHFKLYARWTVFLTPLASVLQIDERQGGPLSGCVLCISADGTIAVIAVDGFQL